MHLRAPSSPIHDSITTDQGVHAAQRWRGPLFTTGVSVEATEMAASAQDLAQAQTRHWAARPLPEPPRSHRVSKSAPPQHDRIGILLEDWMSELTVGNTLDGE